MVIEGKYWFACTYLHDYSRTPTHCINSLYFQRGKYCQYVFWSFLRKCVIVWWTKCPPLQTILQLHTQGTEKKYCLALILVICRKGHLVHRTVTYFLKMTRAILTSLKIQTIDVTMSRSSTNHATMCMQTNTYLPSLQLLYTRTALITKQLFT